MTSRSASTAAARVRAMPGCSNLHSLGQLLSPHTTRPTLRHWLPRTPLRWQKNPFVDGNKRTAFVAMALFLRRNGFDLDADDVSCVLTTLVNASGEMHEADLAIWLRAHMRRRPPKRGAKISEKNGAQISMKNVAKNSMKSSMKNPATDTVKRQP